LAGILDQGQQADTEPRYTKHYPLAGESQADGNNKICDLPVYQCRKAFLLNMAVNCSDTLLNISWMAVELPADGK